MFVPESSTTRQKLLAAAERILIEQGLTGVSVRRVGEVAGVNPTLVTYHFQGIDRLLEKLCQANLAAMIESWQRIDPSARPRQDLETVLRLWIEPMQRPAAFTGMGRAVDVLDEIAMHGSEGLRQDLLQELYRVTEVLDAALAPHCPRLSADQLRNRLRFIAGSVLGPPPRGHVRVSRETGLPIDDLSYLLPFARAALEA